MKTQNLYWPFIVVFLTLATAPIGAHAAKRSSVPAVAIEEVVQLPQYTVTDVRILPMPESWRYAKLPGFEIISEASDRTTRKFVEDFQQLQIVMRTIWPVLANARQRMPALLILCSKPDSFRSFRPEQGWNSDFDIYTHGTSLFLEDNERSAIVIDFGMHELWSPFYMERSLVEPETGTLETTLRMGPIVDPYRVFYQQYTRYLLRRANGGKPLPGWLEEGIVRLVASMDYSKKWIEFGRLDEDMLGIPIASPAAVVAAHLSEPAHHATNMAQAPHTRRFTDGQIPFGRLMSLEKMFSENPEDRKGESRWGAQCYLFAHMCLYGWDRKYQKPFVDFARRASQGPVTEDDFKECFGRTYKQMSIELRGHGTAASYKHILYKAGRKAPSIFSGLTKPELREATQAEIGRIKGETLRLAGYPIESREAFIVPYIRGEREPDLLASLGLLERLEGRNERALRFLEAADAARAERPRAYLALAQIRLENALAKPEGPDNRLNPAQVASILAPLYKARRQSPPMAEVYQTIAHTWLHSEQAPPEGDFNMLMEGVKRFPRNPGLVYHASKLFLLNGQQEQAAELIKLGLKITPDSEMRNAFAELNESK